MATLETNATEENVEGRGLAGRNSREQNTPQTQRWLLGVPQKLERIREAAGRDSRLRFTALFHHVYDPDALREAYFGLKRKAAPGVDGVTWQEYGEDLENNLRDLSARLKRGGYRAKPVRRTYIPKADGRQRPLGVTALEDKVVQASCVAVLEAIYETDFAPFSYGFRPGRNQHNALDALSVGLEKCKVNWVLDADIRGFFDAIVHEWLVKFVGHRIADRRIVRLIRKWLNAGVLEKGRRIEVEGGTPQGGVISPLLANVYLHYVLDLWARQWRTKRAKGDMIIIRYADDVVVGFQHRHEAEQFLEELKERFAEFGLELHPEKTRLIEFGRFARSNRQKRGEGGPETFDFLGFTHLCGTGHNGWFEVQRQTIRKRMVAKLEALKVELRLRMHAPTPETGRWLKTVITGHFQYFGVPGNRRQLASFRDTLARYWKQVLGRRSQKGYVSWKTMAPLLKRWIPPVRIVHPYPRQRLVV